MKPTIEKPHDPIMRFFTPELFVQYNSPNDEEADHADESWESAIRRYKSHLAKLRPLMPAQTKRLADLCVHDAEVLACDRFTGTSSELPPIGFCPEPGYAIITSKQDDVIVSLIYLLWDDLRKHQYDGDWPFSKQRPHWLYDEIDVAPFSDALFVHRVLFSDGIILEIPFVSVLIQKAPLHALDDSAWSKQFA